MHNLKCIMFKSKSIGSFSVYHLEITYYDLFCVDMYILLCFFFPFDGANIGNHGSFSSTAQAFGYYGKLLFNMKLQNI